VTKENPMSFTDIGLIVAVLAAWIVLNRWVLPFFGVPTCMSGACRPTCYSATEEKAPPADAAAKPAKEVSHDD